ncbi:hypothetical protein EDD18DRAFT_221842 [Armillaria luteobubalina]|uniref:WW domain-containing protein n=1 Tax=Armillaria luteobubalina TaxID=153913 RepID=A0AA39Q5U6_9AGAR|nr:hypothetical protein EDD18DRAFT_221842 [Armillaria luteobubalina]
MSLLQWLLRMLRGFVRGHVGGRSPLKAILALWSFFRRQFQRYSCLLHNRASTKGHRETCPPPLNGLDDFKMAMVDGVVDGQPPVSTVVCRSVIPPDNSDSVYTFAVENASQSSLNTVSTFATPMTSRSQVNLADYAHVNLSTHRLPRHGSRPSSIVNLPAGQNSLHPYSCSNEPRSSQNVRHSMPNLGTYAPRNPSSHELSRLRPTFMISNPPYPVFDSESLTALAQPVLPIVPHDGPDVAVPGDITTLTSAYPLFWPIPPESMRRYEREIVERIETDFWIDPLTTSLQSGPDPDGWVAFVHPEGARYFVREKKASPCAGNYHDVMISSGCLLPRIFTDINLYDSDKLKLITKFMDDMEDYIRATGINIYPNVDLVFDLRRNPETGDICCVYYFASHNDRFVFWLDDFDATYFDRWSDVKGVTAASQVGYEVEAQYWYHCQLFPTCREMDMKTINELADILIHSIGDLMTSDTANCAYDLPTLQQMLALTNSIKETFLSGNHQSPGSVSSASRFMYIFVHQRFYNFHGLPAARLEIEHSVYGTEAKRSPLVILLSPLLFFAPDIHLDSLNKLWGDGLVKQTGWDAFIKRLNTDWQDLIINSTVLLNANVAFLAIQSVDDSSTKEGRSPAQISSYISIIASIGSIILGLLLIRKNRSKEGGKITAAWDFLRSQHGRYTGLETLAIMYSLPYALLMWATVTFLSAFTLMCFTASDVAVRMLVGTAWLAIAVLISWCIMTSWEGKYGDDHWYMLVSALVTKFRQRLPRAPSTYVVKKINRLSRTKTRHSVNSEATAVDV